MREDPFEDLGYGKLPGKVRDLLPPVDPVPPPWAGQDWRDYAGHRCKDHDDADGSPSRR